MICTAPDLADAAAGAREPAFAGVPAGAPGRSCDLPDGFPLRRTGRSLSSSAAGGSAGAEEAAGAGPAIADGAELEAAGGLTCGAVCAGVAGGVGSDGLGFSELERRNTGGASRSSAGGFDGGVFFFAAAAAIALADCQVPSPIQVFLACSAPVTVNSP